MGQLHVYFTPRKLDGTFGDEVEVTKDVLLRGLGNIKEQLDTTEYDIGIFRTSNINLTMRNDHGRYSEPGSVGAIFGLIRYGTKVRFAWEQGIRPLVCGFFSPDHVPLSIEETFYNGLLADDNTRQDIDDQTITFQVLGFENILNRLPRGALTVGVTDFEDFIFNCLNQSEFTEYVDVDVSNISTDLNLTFDDIEEFDNATALEALKKTLALANSVMYIKDNTVFVSPRKPTNDLIFSFFGQASILGLENILDIKGYSNGINRLYNFVRWTDTNLVIQDAASVNEFGIYARDIDSRSITDTSKRNQILTAIRDEFGRPFVEFKISTYLTLETLNLFLLDRVQVDHPSLFEPAEGGVLPIYDNIAAYDKVFRYPLDKFNLVIVGEKRFKIIAKTLDVLNDRVEFDLREFDPN